MPYATDFVCTYHIYDKCCNSNDEGDDGDDEGDKNLLYQMQFLQAFGLREYDGAKIDETLTELAGKIDSSPKLREVIMQHPLLDSPDTSTASCADILPFLFTYNSFHAFHKCVIDLYGASSHDYEHGGDNADNADNGGGGGGAVSHENLAALFDTYATIAK